MTPTGAVQHLATWGLLGGPSQPIDLSVVDREQIARHARHHRISGVVLAALDTGASTSEDADLRSRLVADQLVLLGQTLQAEADLVRAVRLIDAADIEVRVLKGLATAHLDHADPAVRATSDADILVPHDQLALATAAVADLTNHETTVPDRSRRHVDVHGKDRTLRLTSGGWLDLHRLIAPAYWGLSIDHTKVFAEPASFTVAGTELFGLPHDWRFIHAVLHAGYSADVSMHSVRDVLTVGARLPRPADELLDSASLRPIRGLLAEGVRRTEASLGIEVPGSNWAHTVRPSTRERVALRARSLSGKRDHWTGPLALPPHRWPGYIAPILLPSRSYLDWYGRSRAGHIRSARGARRSRRDDA